jgi:hypothetical protein
MSLRAGLRWLEAGYLDDANDERVVTDWEKGHSAPRLFTSHN